MSIDLKQLYDYTQHISSYSIEEVGEMAKNNYWVSPRGTHWVTRREGASRAVGIFNTQRQAESIARNILQSNSGGELIT